MSIWVTIDTFKSDDVIRKPKNAILAYWRCHAVYDVIKRQNDVKSFQQLHHIIIQQI